MSKEPTFQTDLVMTASKDTISVRKDEELDSAALARYLQDIVTEEYSGGGPDSELEIRQFPDGHSNLTYLIRYGGREFVLRRPPVGPVAPTAHDMLREYRLLSIIHTQFPLAPKPILLCEDTSIIGVPFYLMERRRGFVVRANLPPSLENDLGLRRRLSESVLDTLVALHAVDIHATGIVQIGKPAGFVRRQVEGWANRWQRSMTGELVEMDEVINWLTERIPDRIPLDSEKSAAIVHNDFKLDNIMLDIDEPARVVAVLDWEMCTVGDPLIDVGLFLSYWTMNAVGNAGGKSNNQNTTLRAVTHGPGWMTREEIIDRYESQTGRDLSLIVFYETFARFKIAVVIQQIYFRYVQGQTHDERFRNFDQLVLELACKALELAQSSRI
jgi:aminoglycoside phosphotransferase (APT) family kinase protein